MPITCIHSSDGRSQMHQGRTLPRRTVIQRTTTPQAPTSITLPISLRNSHFLVNVSAPITYCGSKWDQIHSSDSPDSDARLSTSYSKMAESLEKIFADGSDHPKLVIAVDEAHPLTPVYPQGQYRPADVFCRVVNEYSHYENHAVWVVFASTTSKVADFSPPNQKRL